MARLFQVDSFTDIPFRGNPAGVCLLDAPRPEAWMRSLASEMNLSETAFLLKKDSGYHLRWFTPTVEVPLCGHATLATAHILWEQHLEKPDSTLCFNTLSGELKAKRDGDDIQLDFPESEVVTKSLPTEVFDALGIKTKPKFVGLKTDFGIGFIEVDDEDVLRNLKPNFTALKAIDIRGAIVTSISKQKDFDFVSRFFGPSVGIDEDPVTGAAHCALGPYWRSRLNRDRLVGYQASARGGVIRIGFHENRVLLGGQAVTVFEILVRSVAL